MGNQCKGFDKLTQLFCPVGQTTTFRVMIADAADADKEVCQLDFTQAFLQSECPTEVYVKPGPGLPVVLDDNGKPMVYRANKSQYGLPFSPKAWNDRCVPYVQTWAWNKTHLPY